MENIVTTANISNISKLNDDAIKNLVANFQKERAEIPEAMLTSETVCNAIIKWVDTQVDYPLKEWNVCSLWGMAIIVIYDSDAIHISQLGLDRVMLGSKAQIYEMLDHYKIKLSLLVNHPEGVWYYNINGLEPDMSCKGCGDQL